MVTANQLRSGQTMEDGSIYVGTLKDGSQVFTTPKDLSLTLTFNDAVAAVESLNASNSLGHNDWHLPTKEELKVLLTNRRKGALKGSFNKMKDKFSHYHWSSTHQTENDANLYTYRFSAVRSWSWFGDEHKLSARPVRVVAPSA